MTAVQASPSERSRHVLVRATRPIVALVFAAVVGAGGSAWASDSASTRIEYALTLPEPLTLPPDVELLPKSFLRLVDGKVYTYIITAILGFSPTPYTLRDGQLSATFCKENLGCIALRATIAESHIKGTAVWGYRGGGVHASWEFTGTATDFKFKPPPSLP